MGVGARMREIVQNRANGPKAGKNGGKQEKSGPTSKRNRRKRGKNGRNRAKEQNWGKNGANPGKTEAKWGKKKQNQGSGWHLGIGTSPAPEHASMANYIPVPQMRCPGSPTTIPVWAQLSSTSSSAPSTMPVWATALSMTPV